MTKAPYQQKMKVKRQHKVTTKNIADRLRTVSWSNCCHPTGMIKPVYGIPIFPLTAKAVLSKGKRVYLIRMVQRSVVHS